MEVCVFDKGTRGDEADIRLVDTKKLSSINVAHKAGQGVVR
jgi:hypothetical protein